MELEEIRLEYNPDTRREYLVGIGDELVPDDRILKAVATHKRIFPYVVKQLAVNQYLKEDPTYVDHRHIPPPRRVLDIMGDIRDELLIGVSSQSAESRTIQLRQAQVQNMTQNVRPERPPYFCR
jgi:hypothetical protein